MRHSPRLFCLDTVLVDVVLKVATFPPRAGDVRALEQLITTGGGFNAMSAARRHDQAVTYAGRLGSGPFSALAVASLAAEKIDVPIECNEELDLGICVVLVESDGERTFVTTTGSESSLRLTDLCGLDVRAGDYVLVSGYNVMYPGFGDVVLEWLASLSSDVVVLFDPATRVEDIPSSNLTALFNQASWLLCNAREATWLARTSDEFDAARSLATSNDRTNVVVRRGSKGCIVALNHAEPESVEGFVTNVIDTNGAGDVHNGVFVAELASGHDPLVAARWANAAAAIAISRLGPAASPSREEVALFIEEASTKDQK